MSQMHGKTRRKVVLKDEHSQPIWVSRRPDEKYYWYFVYSSEGVSGPFKTEDAAIKDANEYVNMGAPYAL